MFPWLHEINRNPDRWILLAAGAAWIFLIVRPHPSGGGGLPGLGAMVIAMMLPMSIGGVRAAARTHGSRAIGGFLVSYVAVWVAVMFIIQQAWTVAAAQVRWTHAAVGITLIAALWEMAPTAWRRRTDCTAGAPERHGWWRDAAAAWSGLSSGAGCVRSCWALMAVCVAFAHNLWVMAIVFAVQLAGRYRPSTSPAWTALAVMAACLVSLAMMRAAGHHHT